MNNNMKQHTQKSDPLAFCQIDTQVQDGQARFEAIHPGRSFIVQAPAGSGKTALLTQRFLALLTQVDKPEQIVAMTFTKKAAAEMRERLFKSLSLGQHPLKDNASLFDQNTWELARLALARDAQQNWQLLKNPNRLRIRTIDSMNGYLVQQMPLLSRLGTQASVSKQSDELYRQAARETFKDTAISDAVAELLQLVNGRYNKAEGLLVEMLQKRDQWMKHLTGVDLNVGRQWLEEALADLVGRELQQARAQLSNHFQWINEALEQAAFARDHGYPDAEILVGKTIDLNTDDLGVWRVLGKWLLTAAGTWRKSVNKNVGFPPGKGVEKTAKDAFVGALANLGTLQADITSAALNRLQNLPDPHYSAQQWHSLQHLVTLLNTAVLHLKLAFQQAAQADFIEIAQAANFALGDEENPTDLAQQLDYQIQHLLIDEFQDTSVEQFDLLKKLTAGWAANDGHTLFIVGDPMQSIYRFREAEVGNFLQAWQGSLGGAGQVVLTPLNLTENFRSKPGMVDWVNHAFAQVLPKHNDIQLGAVKFSAATVRAEKANEPPGKVHGHWGLNWTWPEEKTALLTQIKTTLSDIEHRQQLSTAADKQASKKPETLGVLGRSRSHLLPLALALKAENIAFRAVELEGLASRQEIQDVVALTRALLHLADRPAWIALLRSPLVGLSLAQLYELLGQNDDYFQTPVWQSLQTTVLDIPQLSILRQAIENQAYVPLAQQVRSIWLQLDGPQTLLDSSALQNIEAFWQLLETLSDSAGRLNLQQLETGLASLFANADASPESAQIELMTMHKSKGLEFDHVFLPSLGKKPMADSSGLLSWLRFSNTQGQARLILAPIHQRGSNASALSELIKGFEEQKKAYETGRLLYVAITRAKQHCHLFGSITYKDQPNAEGDVQLKPVKHSLLECLWPVVTADFMTLVDNYIAPDSAQKSTLAIPKVLRLSQVRQGFEQLLAQLPKPDLIESDVNKVAAKTEPETAPLAQPSNIKPLVGTLVHQVLELLTQQTHLWPATTPTDVAVWLQARKPIYESWLIQQGLSLAEVGLALSAVQESLGNALTHKKLHQALTETHSEAASELALSSRLVVGEAQQNHIVDRTWVDGEGQRWILDYKTASLPKGQVQAEFLAQQVAQYQPQLARYGNLFKQLENRPQRWVLYFTALDVWHELVQ